ncbi:MAG: TonB-dependent receptor plug domain-containing protein, partial [Phenylobacterium sp.]
MIGGAAVLLGGQAVAQDQGTSVGELVVTGSRIPTQNLTSSSPITVVGNQEAKLSGVTRTEDLLNQLPQVFAGQGSEVSNGSSGVATVDLRGLGSSRTLVLIDGRRVMPGDPNLPVTDLNFIPAQMVDHVEVLTGGASAVYGSDAVAGVVNFIMTKDFEGVRLDAQVSSYQHNNSNDFFQNLNKAKGYSAPNGSVWDGRQTEFNALIGVNTPDGKGNATVYAGYRNARAILQNARDYTNCTLAETSTSWGCRGSGTTAPAQIISFDLAFQSLPYDFIVDKGGPGNTLRPFAATDVFNFAPYNYFQRPDDRYTAGAFAHYEVNDHMDAYLQAMFMDDHTLAQIAPSGIFGQTFTIPCSSPLFSAQEVQTLCTNAGLNPATDSATMAILRRNVEGGGRLDNLRHTDYRIVLGAKGAINEDWNYDLYGQIGRNVYQEEYNNDFSLRRIGNALDATTDANGNLVCAGGNADGCAVYNPFSLSGVTPASLTYVQTPGFKEGSTTEMVVSGSVNGTLSALKSPAATEATGIALGAEYRRENLDLRVDQEFDSGDLAGQGGPTHGVSGAYQVYELFGELRVPLIQDMPFAKSLTFETGYRYSDYSSAGIAHSYKFAGDWQPIDDLRIRASYQRAVRAPNVVELFTPSGIGLGLAADPCAGNNPTAANAFATAANCAHSGVDAAHYGHVSLNPAGQYNALLGGNSSLSPEKADTFSVGGVLTPRMLPGFSLTVDYFNIDVKNYIQGLNADQILSQCIITGSPTLCGLVHRDPNSASLWLGQTGYVDGRTTNVGFLKTSGVDIEANYRLPLDHVGLNDAGSLSFNFVGTYLKHLITDPGIPFTNAAGQVLATNFDCTGLYGRNTCGTPNPKWRHRVRVTWATPWSGLTVSGNWRYFGAVDAVGTSTNPYLASPTYPVDRKLGAQNWFDLATEWKVMDKVTFNVGVNNIFDKEPPLVGSN